ncbi:MAG: hypothetical protein Q7S48_03785 [bacterium]|nr:hypothetical protein [bacterium]
MSTEGKRPIIDVTFSAEAVKAEEEKRKREDEATMKDFEESAQRQLIKEGRNFDHIKKGVPDDILDHQIIVRGTGEAQGWYLVGHLEDNGRFTDFLIVDASKNAT